MSEVAAAEAAAGALEVRAEAKEGEDVVAAITYNSIMIALSRGSINAQIREITEAFPGKGKTAGTGISQGSKDSKISSSGIRLGRRGHVAVSTVRIAEEKEEEEGERSEKKEIRATPRVRSGGGRDHL